MADIFLSYSREDLDTARRFAQAFERAGLSVWWDQALNAGEAYDHVTERALQEARVVAVLWSRTSVESRWVRAEATQAERNGTLVPAMIEPCKRPIMFELVHTADLAHWRGDAGDSAWQVYLAGVRRFVERGQSPAPSAPAPGGHGTAAVAGQRRGALWIAVAALLLVLAGGFAWLKFRASAPPAAPAVSATPAPPAKPRIAVLPFENLSPDPANAFFTDGMHEELLTVLANNAPGLEVISRTTMDSYKGKSVTVQQLATQLACAYVLEGSVRREGDAVRLTLQLINARDDSHVWAQDYDRKLVSAMTLQSEVAGEVAKALAAKLTGDPGGAAQSAAPVTKDPHAYDLYLQARIAFQGITGFSSLADAQQAIGLYDRALQIDPSILRAYVDRINLRTFMFLLGKDSFERTVDAAKQELAVLRKLAPEDPQTLFAAALIATAEIDYARALQLYEAAQAKGLVDSDLLAAKAGLLASMGRFEESEKINRQLAALDPANGTRQYNWWGSLMEQRRPQDAIDVANLGMAKWAQDPRLSGLWRYLRNVTLFMFGKDPGRADAIARLLTSPPTLDNLGTDDLRYDNHLIEARKRIDAVGVGNIIAPDMYAQVLRWNTEPLARERGWLDLFLGDKAEARKDGQRVLDFLAHNPETRWNKWFLTILRSEAALFMGDNDAAVKYVDQAVALTNATQEKSDQSNAQAWRALILAWTGHTDEAAQLLEGFATSIYFLWPGEVVYNPGWNIALKDNARYQALRARLMAQIAAARLN